MKNVYLPVPGHESRYLINSLGHIITRARVQQDSLGRIITKKPQSIKTFIDKRSGYLVAKLTKNDGRIGTQYVHRLVAKAFLHNTHNKPVVNHVNGLKTDCSVENLEWVTRSENQLHAINAGLSKLPYENNTMVVDICTGEEFKSITEAALCKGIPYRQCIYYLRNSVANPTCLRIAA